MQYHPDKADYQLFFAQETSAEKKLLKSIEMIAHRYGTSDTTLIILMNMMLMDIQPYRKERTIMLKGVMLQLRLEI